jgi:ABC-2 type transport system ATP-binding protein
VEPVLEASGLVKRYRRTTAVAGVDLAVAAGERVALLGLNGAGKTTTLLMLLGAITPDEGQVRVLGHRLPEGRSRAMEGVGFAAGYLPLPDRLRVGEVLGVFANLYGVADPGPAIDAGLERFRIGHLAGAMTNELSSGQRTLVGIIKATLHRPRLLVLDEPTASLDPDTGDWVRSYLEDYRARTGATILMASHNMSEVERLCSDVIMMRAGHIVDRGSPEALIDRYGRTNLEEVFLHIARGSRALQSVS